MKPGLEKVVSGSASSGPLSCLPLMNLAGVFPLVSCWAVLIASETQVTNDPRFYDAMYDAIMVFNV